VDPILNVGFNAKIPSSGGPVEHNGPFHRKAAYWRRDAPLKHVNNKRNVECYELYKIQLSDGCGAGRKDKIFIGDSDPENSDL
jgi:hypothetical protein